MEEQRFEAFARAESSLQFGERTFGRQSSVMNDRHSAAQPLRLVQKMRRKQDSPAGLGDFAHQFVQHQRSVRIEAVGRLVEHDQFRLVQQRGISPSFFFIPLE